MRAPLAVIAAAALLVSVSVLAATPASAADPTQGNDVSYPQCGAALPPTSPSFAIVGVNGGLANTTNPCFADERAWASTSPGGGGQPGLAYYVNTANPGLAGAWWPDANATQPSSGSVVRTPVAVANPYGVCAHGADAACAYVYGYSMARDDATIRGVSDAGSRTWWLDVETLNTWQPDLIANRASLEGMTAYFRGIGARVGVYSTPAHWAEIIGVVPATSPLATAPSWLALGPVTYQKARKQCGAVPFTPRGRLEMTQLVANGFDYDVACLQLSPKKPTITGTSVLTAKPHAWKPSTVTLKYRWFRNGVAVATGRTYRATTPGKYTVAVTGKALGYSTTTVTSKVKRIR